MKYERNCGMPFPVYPNMPQMMPPMMSPMPVAPQMAFPTTGMSTQTCPSQSNIENRLCNMQRQIDSLDRRCTALEQAMGSAGTSQNQSNTYNDSNFQMI